MPNTQPTLLERIQAASYIKGYILSRRPTSIFETDTIDDLQTRLSLVLIRSANDPNIPNINAQSRDASLKGQAARIASCLESYFSDGKIGSPEALDDIRMVLNGLVAIRTDYGSDSDHRDVCELVRDTNRYRNRHFPFEPFPWRYS